MLAVKSTWANHANGDSALMVGRYRAVVTACVGAGYFWTAHTIGRNWQRTASGWAKHRADAESAAAEWIDAMRTLDASEYPPGSFGAREGRTPKAARTARGMDKGGGEPMPLASERGHHAKG